MNEKRMLTGVLIDPETNTCGVRTIEDSLDSFYKLLRCDLIDIVDRKVGDTSVSIICDDEGLLKENPWVSAVSFNHDDLGYTPALVGPLFVVAPGTDEEGNLLSLSTDDQFSVFCKICHMWSENHSTVHPVLTKVDY